MAEGPANRHEQATRPAPSGRKAWRYAPLVTIVAGLALAYAMGWQDYFSLEFLGESRQALKRFVAGNPVVAPVGFVILYAVAIAFSFPAASILTIFSGFLFGWLAGGVYAVIAATCGATALFLAARSAFGGVLRAKVGGRAAKLADGFEKDAFGYLLVLRLAPFIPFLVVNIAPALFDVRLRTFFAATLIGVIPGAFAYAWLGQGVDSVLVAARSGGREIGVSDLVTPEITAAFIVLALVAALSLIVRRVWGPRVKK